MAAAVSIAKGPRWLTRDSGTLALILLPPVELVRARELLHFPQLRLKYIIHPVSPSLGVEMYSISDKHDVINHAQHVFEIQKSQLARVVSHQITDHFVPPCHVAIHEICHCGAHQRVLCYRAQHHKHGPVLLLQFIQEAYQQRLPLALRSHWGSRDVVGSQHYHQRIQVIVALEFHHLDDLSHRGSSKG